MVQLERGADNSNQLPPELTLRITWSGAKSGRTGRGFESGQNQWFWGDLCELADSLVSYGVSERTVARECTRYATGPEAIGQIARARSLREGE